MGLFYRDQDGVLEAQQANTIVALTEKLKQAENRATFYKDLWDQSCIAVSELCVLAGAVGLGQQGPGAVEMGKGATAVDVGHEQAARIGRARHAQRVRQFLDTGGLT